MLSRAAVRFARSSSSSRSNANALSVTIRPLFESPTLSFRAFASAAGGDNDDPSYGRDENNNPFPDLKESLSKAQKDFNGKDFGKDLKFKNSSFDEKEFNKLMEEATAQKKTQSESTDALAKLAKGKDGDGSEEAKPLDEAEDEVEDMPVEEVSML